MIKAIETEYNGYKFRSRLEARWAVFFDAVGIQYQYEPEGFELENGKKYLPDFYLPDLDLWVEVKGVMSNYDWERIKEFIIQGKIKRFTVLSEIFNPNLEGKVDGIEWYPYDFDKDEYYGAYLTGYVYNNETVEVADDWPYVFCVCPVCGKVGFEYYGRGARVCGDKCTIGDKGYSGAHPKLLNAYKKACQARFEHGERP